jgi:hypothetical protein
MFLPGSAACQGRHRPLFGQIPDEGGTTFARFVSFTSTLRPLQFGGQGAEKKTRIATKQGHWSFSPPTAIRPGPKFSMCLAVKRFVGSGPASSNTTLQ